MNGHANYAHEVRGRFSITFRTNVRSKKNISSDPHGKIVHRENGDSS